MFGGSGGALPPFPTPAKRLLLPPLVRLNRRDWPDAGSNPGLDLFKNVLGGVCEDPSKGWLRGLATTYTELDCCEVRILLIEGWPNLQILSAARWCTRQ
jgi:hypothetical protein